MRANAMPRTVNGLIEECPIEMDHRPGERLYLRGVIPKLRDAAQFGRLRDTDRRVMFVLLGAVLHKVGLLNRPIHLTPKTNVWKLRAGLLRYVDRVDQVLFWSARMRQRLIEYGWSDEDAALLLLDVNQAFRDRVLPRVDEVMAQAVAEGIIVPFEDRFRVSREVWLRHLRHSNEGAADLSGAFDPDPRNCATCRGAA